MKRTRALLLIFLLCGFAFQVFSIVPEYYGARSLSLGYASSAFNYDINGMFLNPANLAALPYSISGYQYQQSYLDYKGFTDDLDNVLDYNLSSFESLSSSDKESVMSGLEQLYSSRAGMHGFDTSVVAYAGGKYGLAVSFVNTAVVNPVSPLDEGIFDRHVDDITNADIAQLQMNFLGLKYRKYSLSYAMDLYQSVTLGITLHYLNGKVTQFNRSILDDVFTAGTDTKDYLQHAWKNTEEKFNQFVIDAGLSMDLGRYFRIGLAYRNVSAAKIKTDNFPTIKLPKRMIAGLAFRPTTQWGIYVDMDIRKTDLLFNGEEMQPFSIGVEKSFFSSQFFVRAGMMTDLTEKKIFGGEANTLYGMGIGFNLKRIVVDVAIGIDNGGSIKNLAISGFIILK